MYIITNEAHNIVKITTSFLEAVRFSYKTIKNSFDIKLDNKRIWIEKDEENDNKICVFVFNPLQIKKDDSILYCDIEFFKNKKLGNSFNLIYKLAKQYYEEGIGDFVEDLSDEFNCSIYEVGDKIEKALGVFE